MITMETAEQIAGGMKKLDEVNRCVSGMGRLASAKLELSFCKVDVYGKEVFEFALHRDAVSLLLADMKSWEMERLKELNIKAAREA